MWIFMNDSFLSIVKKDCGADELLVRARRPGDIERLFPKANVIETPDADYRYRAAVRAEDVAEELRWQIMYLDYSNFKKSVENDELRAAYGRVWADMMSLQTHTRKIRRRKR